MSIRIDFIAKVKFRTAKEGGRKSPAVEDYRPDLKFEFSEFMFMAHQSWIEKDIVYPGDEIHARVTLASPHLLANKLAIGTGFTLNEGIYIVGHGQIEEIINPDLIKKV